MLYIAVILYIMIYFISSVNSVTIPTPYAYYKLDNNNFGNIVNGLYNATNVNTINTTGKILSARYFDGNNDLVYWANNTFGSLSEGTISMWVNVISFATKRTLFSFGTPTGTFLISTTQTTGKIQVTYYSNGGALWYDFTSNQVLNVSQWTYVSVSVDSGGNKLYINGNEWARTYTRGSTANTYFLSNIPSSADSVRIGSQYDNNNDMLGKIDELGIWDSALSISEISFLYNSGNGKEYPFIDIPIITTNLSNNTFSNKNYKDIKINTITGIKTNISYKLNSGSVTSICSNCNTTTLQLTGLTDGEYNISFYSNSTFGNMNLNRVFNIDTQAPNITNNIPTNISNYNFLGSWFSCSDNDLQSCNISIDGFNVANGTNFELNHNGNLNYTITGIDNVGNSNEVTGTLYINPFFYIYFNNNTNFINNFSINGTNYLNYFSGQIYDYGLGTHEFLFIKTGLEETYFNLTFTNTSKINTTIYINPVYIIIDLKNTEDGGEAPISNYTILISDLINNISNSYEIINDNELIIENNYAENQNITISVIFNSTITNTIALITTRQNVTIPIYITTASISTRAIEVLTSSLTAIVGTEVNLYVFIPNVGFVLETTKTTNTLGQVVFNIVELTRIYNICNTYLQQQVCLNQITFENAETDPYQIVYSDDFVNAELNYLNYISWSWSEIKTNISSEMTMTFSDSQSITSAFCYDVTRYTNNSPSFIGAYCNNNSNGQEVNTFSLINNQKIEYIFYFMYNDTYNELSTYTTYAENIYIQQANQVNLFDVIFLLIYFASIGILLKFKNLNVYNLGIIIILTLIFMVQAYFNQQYVYTGIWSFLVFSKAVYHATRVET